MVYLQVNALSEWIIVIYLHEFTNSEREVSIPHSVFTCTSSLIMNEKFQYPARPPSAVLKISSSLLVNELFIIRIEYIAKKSSNFESAEAIA